VFDCKTAAAALARQCYSNLPYLRTCVSVPKPPLQVAAASSQQVRATGVDGPLSVRAQSTNFRELYVKQSTIGKVKLDKDRMNLAKAIRPEYVAENNWAIAILEGLDLVNKVKCIWPGLCQSFLNSTHLPFLVRNRDNQWSLQCTAVIGDHCSYCTQLQPVGQEGRCRCE
jgi:hypothetical protein